MGNWFCRGKKLRILIQGLDCAGKTTLLYRIKLNETVTTIPTIGFNVETVTVGGAEITCWDLGGRDKVRPLIRHYYPNTQGLISVIDSSDKERLDEALDDLIHYILEEDETRETVVMVLANKQDKAGALTAQEIEDALVNRYTISQASSRTVFVMPCCAASGEGVYEAFSYMAEQMILKASHRAKQGLITVRERTAQQEAKAGSEQDKRSGYAEAMLRYLLKNPYDYFKTILIGDSLGDGDRQGNRNS